MITTIFITNNAALPSSQARTEITVLAALLAPRLARAGVHYGWVIAAVTFLVSLTTAGAMGLPGALILPLSKEFGWDVGQISSALALRILLYGLMAPFAAALMDRYGVKRMIVAALALIVAGLVLALTMTRPWQLFAYWGVLVGLGTGITALVMSAIIATRWFNQKRGLVLGILTASSATGQLLFLPLAAWLAEHVGWRYALAPSLIGLLLAGALALLLMCENPSDIGLAPYGDPAPAPGRSAPRAAAPASFWRAFTVLGDVSTSSAFWILFATFFVCGLSTNGLIQTHFISFCADYGMDEVAAASTLAMMGVFDLFGTILSGWLSDRYDNRALLFVYYGVRGLSLLYLPSSTFTVYGLSLFAVFYGLDWIATVPPTVRLAAQQFGKERAGIAFGWIFAAHQLGAASAAFGGGLARSALQTYLPAFYIGGGACLFAAGIVWLIGARKSPREAPAAA
jgi:MFS family permease